MLHGAPCLLQLVVEVLTCLCWLYPCAQVVVPIQALVRGWQARRRVAHMRYLYSAARDIQRVYRGYVGRQWFAYLLHEERVRKGAEDINRVYRGFRARRLVRRALWRKRGPSAPRQWVALRDKSRSYLRREWKGWQEFHVANTVSGCCCGSCCCCMCRA